MIIPFKLGLAGGILWGLMMFFFTIISIYTGYGFLWLTLMKTVYIGYDITWIGSAIGLAYGFIDAFICLYLLAWLYNKLV